MVAPEAAVVLGDGSPDPAPAVAELARGLADLGVGVAEVPLPRPGSEAEVDQELAAAAERLGPLDLVVVPVLPAGHVDRRPLVELDPAAWERACEAPLRSVRLGLVAGYRVLAGRGGVIVVVGPMAGTTGEAGLVGYGAAGEGARALVRSCSRTWGVDGAVRVHSVVVPTGLLLAGLAGDAGAGPADGEGERLTLWDEALGRAPTLRGDVAAVVAGLAAPAMAFTTGTSVAVDGGVVMHS